VSSPQEDTAPLPAGEIQRRAVEGSFWTGTHVALYLPVAFVANALIARNLGVDGYGELAFLTVALALAFPLANLGFTPASIQAGSRAEAAGRRGEADSLLRRSLGFHLMVELPILVGLALALTWDKPVWQVAALGTVVVLSCLFSGPALVLTIENRIAAGAKIAIGVNFVMQAAAVATALLTASASAVWAVRSLVPAAGLAINLLVIDRARRRVVLRARFPRGLGRDFWRFALLTWVGSIVGLLVFSRSEIFLLEAFDQPVALGLFALAFGLSQQMTAPADALLHPLLPAISGILSSFPERAQAAFERSTRVSALVCGGIAAAVLPLLVFAVPLIYGDEFQTAAWLLVPLALASMFQSVNNPVLAFVNARQRAGLRLKVLLVALVFDVAIAVATIPALGAWGAVLAAVAGQLIAIAWLAFAEPFARGLGAAGFVRLQAAFIVGTVSAAFALLGALAVEQWSSSGAAVFAVLVGSALFVIGIRLTQSGITGGDRNALVHALPSGIRAPMVRLLRPLTSTP
jgi:O-antigen/teichoic acid export membrane protein